MAKLILNETVIKVKSEELHIPFSNLLPSAIIEYLLYRVSESDVKEQLWLKNSSSLGLESYRRKPVFDLSFYYVKAVSAEELHATVEQLFHVDEAAPELSFTLDYQEPQENNYQVHVTAKLGMMEVPLYLRIEVLKHAALEPSKGELRLFLQNNKVIHFWQYPCEQRVAECFVTILEKMELINELAVYQEIYTVLTKETLDGRRIQQQIIETGRKHEVPFGANRLSTILSYRNYTYMKKKWKSYLKQEQKKTPAWEEVIDVMERFFTPIWEAIIEDRIYIGDWMPELSRFLD